MEEAGGERVKGWKKGSDGSDGNNDRNELFMTTQLEIHERALEPLVREGIEHGWQVLEVDDGVDVFQVHVRVAPSKDFIREWPARKPSVKEVAQVIDRLFCMMVKGGGK